MADEKHVSLGNLAKFKEKYDEKLAEELATRVNVEEGKSLSANDFTNELKATLESALQLDDLITYAKKSDISSVFKYKGSKENFADLPLENEIGDTWDIVNADKEHGVDAGDNLTWNGESWDNLSGVVNLTAINIKLGEMETAVENIGKVDFVSEEDINSLFMTTVKLPYLTFESVEGNAFNVKLYPTWDGKLEYSTDTENWSEINKSTTLQTINSSNDGKLYFRGNENSVITGDDGFNKHWAIYTTSNTDKIKCVGNIENLLDYTTTINGEHPTMGQKCFFYMFYNWNSLITPPELPATKLSVQCYQGMFEGCGGLIEAPELPATELEIGCYNAMFYRCTSLTKVPKQLPATTLVYMCYTSMFQNCTSLNEIPKLPALVLANNCYQAMFRDCTSLVKTPSLPATTLATRCYDNMFYRCTSLTTAPDLPATVLAKDCYYEMFTGCTKLVGTIHCPDSVKYNSENISKKGDLNGNVTVIYDL